MNTICYLECRGLIDVEVKGKSIRTWDNLGRVIMMCVRYILVLDRLETSDVGEPGTDVGHPEWGGQQCGEE